MKKKKKKKEEEEKTKKKKKKKEAEEEKEEEKEKEKLKKTLSQTQWASVRCDATPMKVVRYPCVKKEFVLREG